MIEGCGNVERWGSFLCTSICILLDHGCFVSYRQHWKVVICNIATSVVPWRMSGQAIKLITIVQRIKVTLLLMQIPSMYGGVGYQAGQVPPTPMVQA